MAVYEKDVAQIDLRVWVTPPEILSCHCVLPAILNQQ